MKNTCKALGLFLTIFSFLLLGSCSKEEATTTESIENFKQSAQFDTTEGQLEKLTKKMRRFHNFQVAQAQGYTVLAGPYVPNMGYHFLNPNLINGEFNLLEPEILVYHEDENGNMVFGAAEYLIHVADFDNPPAQPEGFIGNEDHWHLNPNAGGWTLHAWVGLENPDGVFAGFNPDVPAAPTN